MGSLCIYIDFHHSATICNKIVIFGFIHGHAFYLLAAVCVALAWIPGGCGQTTDLSLFLATIPPNVTEITQSNQYYPVLFDQAFASFMSLKKLELEGNEIHTIGSQVFPASLEELYLSHNQIETIHLEAFYNLTFLRNLDLSFNKIKNLPSSLFATVGSRALDHSLYLNLNNNELCTLDPDLFLNSPRFSGIELKNNRISCVPALVFAKTETNYITLKNNELTVISPEILATEMSLDIYNNFCMVHGCPFMHIDFLRMGIDISLSGNKIASVPAEILSQVHGTVVYFFLSNNRISYIHPEAFKTYKPWELFLDNNQLTCLPESVFLNFDESYYVHYVYLNYNNLTTLHPDAFFGPDWTDPPVFPIDNYGPYLSLSVAANPLLCKTICWLMHATYIRTVDCADGVEWSTWDGLDNGQCVIPPAPECPPPTQIPVAPNQCPGQGE